MKHITLSHLFSSSPSSPLHEPMPSRPARSPSSGASQHTFLLPLALALAVAFGGFSTPRPAEQQHAGMGGSGRAGPPSALPWSPVLSSVVTFADAFTDAQGLPFTQVCTGAQWTNRQYTNRHLSVYNINGVGGIRWRAGERDYRGNWQTDGMRGWSAGDTVINVFETYITNCYVPSEALVFDLYHPWIDNMKQRKVIADNMRYGCSGYSSGLFFTGIDYNVSRAEITSDAYSGYHIEVTNSYFERYGSQTGTDARGAGLEFFGQFPPNTVVIVRNNTFAATGREVFEPYWRCYRIFGCQIINFWINYFGDNNMITIENNDFPNCRCYDTTALNSVRIEVGLHEHEDNLRKEHGPIQIGTPFTIVPVGHGSVIAIRNNSLQEISCAMASNGALSTGHCAVHAVSIHTLQPMTGSKILIHDNIFNASFDKQFHLAESAIEARQLVFYKREEGDTRDPALLSIRNNFMRTNNPHSYALRMHPESDDHYRTNFNPPRAMYSEVLAPFVNNSEGGTILFDNNTLIGYTHPVKIQFPGPKRVFEPTLAFNFSFSNNRVESSMATTPVTIVNTTVTTPNSHFVIEGNTFMLNRTQANHLVLLDNLTIAGRTSFAFVSNVGIPFNTTVLPNMTAFMASTATKFVEAAPNLVDFSYCNNTMLSVPLESDHTGGLLRARIGDGLNTTYPNAFCYRCGCYEYGTPLPEDRFCPTRPYCCTLAPPPSGSDVGADVYFANCPRRVHADDPFPIVRVAEPVAGDDWVGL